MPDKLSLHELFKVSSYKRLDANYPSIEDYETSPLGQEVNTFHPISPNTYCDYDKNEMH